MLAKVMNWGRQPVLVTRLNVRQYGHLGLEILMSFLRARQEQKAVYFLRPREVVSEALFGIDSPEVRLWPRRSDLEAYFRCRWTLDELRTHVKETRDQFLAVARKHAVRRLKQYETARPRSKAFRAALRAEEQQLVLAARRRPDGPEALPLYYQRRLLRQKIRVQLRPEVAERAERLAAEHGIGPDARIVSLHVREGGFKFGREMQDAKPDARDDSVRNARIETYFDAIDFLVARGYTVVRLGDPTMTPVRRAGVVDLATAPNRDQVVELWVLLRSEFFLSGEAGPVGVSYLTNTPLLTVNATDPISSYPIRSDGMYIVKRVVDRQTNQPLTLRDMLSDDYLANVRNISRFRYVDNTSEEIVASVVEMLAWLRGGGEETAFQRMYRDMAVEAGDSLRARLTYVRKWGADERFMGDGRIAAFFAERYLDQPAVC